MAKSSVTLGKNDVHIKCTENLKQYHALMTPLLGYNLGYTEALKEENKYMLDYRLNLSKENKSYSLLSLIF